MKCYLDLHCLGNKNKGYFRKKSLSALEIGGGGGMLLLADLSV